MRLPDVAQFAPTWPRKAPDPNDPRALELLRPWTGEGAPRLGWLGVPFDGAVAGRRGAAGGPAAIREAMRFSSAYLWEADVRIPGERVADLGDVVVAAEDTQTTHERVQRAVAAAVGAGVEPIVLGGDNSITFATVAGVLDAVEGPVGILDLDAHLDVRVAEPVVNSGTPYRRILDLLGDRVAAENVAQIGHRQFANSHAYREWADGRGIRIFDMQRVRADGFEAVLEDAMAAAGDGTEHLVVSVDMDALDQVFAPGVSAPTPLGLTPRDLMTTMQAAAADDRTRLLEVVEVAPNLDPTGNTARLAAVATLEYAARRIGVPPE